MYDELEAAASVCEEVAAEFDRDPVDSVYKKTEEAARSLDASWSRSWAGYQARCYWRNFDPAEHSFSIEWGVRGAPPGASTFRPSGYVERDTAEVIAEIRKRAGVDDTPLREAANRAMATFASNKREILTTLDASLAGTPDAALRAMSRALLKSGCSGGT